MRIEGSTHGVYRGDGQTRQANFTLPRARKHMKNKVRALREDRGWSQAEFARRLGISRQSVHSIETGRFDPSLPLALRIVALLDLTIEDVFEKPAPVRPNEDGKSKESGDVGRSSPSDQRHDARTKAKKGEGDKADR